MQTKLKVFFIFMFFNFNFSSALIDSCLCDDEFNSSNCLNSNEIVYDINETPMFRHTILVSVIYLIAYSLVFILGFIGNCCVIFVVIRSSQMRNATNFFICNLALADMLVVICCLPATLIGHLFKPWILGWFLCKAVSYFQGVAVSASINTLMAVSIERYLAICFPFKPQMRGSQAKKWIIIIWILSLSIASPWAFFFQLSPMYQQNSTLENETNSLISQNLIKSNKILNLTKQQKNRSVSSNQCLLCKDKEKLEIKFLEKFFFFFDQLIMNQLILVSKENFEDYAFNSSIKSVNFDEIDFNYLNLIIMKWPSIFCDCFNFEKINLIEFENDVKISKKFDKNNLISIKQKLKKSFEKAFSIKEQKLKNLNDLEICKVQTNCELENIKCKSFNKLVNQVNFFQKFNDDYISFEEKSFKIENYENKNYENEFLNYELCTELWPNKTLERTYFIFANLILCYLFPLIIISACYIAIWTTVWHRSVPGEFSEKKNEKFFLKNNVMSYEIGSEKKKRFKRFSFDFNLSKRRNEKKNEICFQQSFESLDENKNLMNSKNKITYSIKNSHSLDENKLKKLSFLEMKDLNERKLLIKSLSIPEKIQTLNTKKTTNTKQFTETKQTIVSINNNLSKINLTNKSLDNLDERNNLNFVDKMKKFFIKEKDKLKNEKLNLSTIENLNSEISLPIQNNSSNDSKKGKKTFNHQFDEKFLSKNLNEDDIKEVSRKNDDVFELKKQISSTKTIHNLNKKICRSKYLTQLNSSIQTNRFQLILQRSRYKVAKMMIIVVLVFFLSWLPLYLIFTKIKLSLELTSFPDSEDRIIRLLAPFAQWLGASNSCINPLLYAFFNKKYYSEFVKIFSNINCLHFFKKENKNDLKNMKTLIMKKQSKRHPSMTTN
uniref:Neuropeptide SIFamide receptor n=1 Tax=Polyphagotarsonemus latus TaxID=1204166 RepID=A0AAN0LHY1_9ACAR